MKILYVIQKSTDGGAVTTTRSRINAFRKRGIEAEVLFFSRGDGAKLFKGIPHYYVKGIDDFQKRITKGGYDCIIFVYALDYLKHMPGSYKGKKIYELRGWTNGSVTQVSKKDISKSVDALVCIAKYIKPLVRPYFRKDIPIFVDGNTVDPMFQYVKSSKRSWANAPKPAPNHSVIAFVGRVDHNKNWREFIKIFRILAKKHPIEAWFISNPSSREIHDMHQECLKHQLKYKVVHVFNEHMPELYSIVADSGGCVLSTSLSEGLGNSILESMACQCPVVSSDKPGKNEIITHEHNGMLYKLRDINKGAGCVEKILKDPPFRQNIIQNALSTIQNDYNQDVYVDRYLNILSKIK